MTSPTSGPSNCALCPTPRPAASCRGCARENEEGTHFIDARLTKPADVVIVAESSVVPRIYNLSQMHRPFSDDAGSLVVSAVNDIRKKHPALAGLTVSTTYSVLCSGMDPNKNVTDRCSGFLKNSIRMAGAQKAPVLVVMGNDAAKSIGLKSKSLKEIQSRVIPGVHFEGKEHTVIATVSTKMLASQPGIYNIFYADLLRALQIAAVGDVAQVPLAELTKDYLIPQTIDEVRDVCDLILGYADSGKNPEQWSISVDTETNTLFPHRENLKVLCVSFAWALGRSCAIPLWHKETPYDPALAVKYIRQVLESKKPKCFHNAKYDLKVFQKLGWPVENFAWDTMTGEHLLEEDKRGQYGLKQITRVQYPEFAGYADELHDLQVKAEGGASQLEGLRKAKDEKAAAKVPGKKKKKVDTGGFENVPLDTLLKYAAVDTDMTRRISVRQIQRSMREDAEVKNKRDLVARDRFRQYNVPQLCTSASPVRSLMATGVVPVTKTLARMEYQGVRVDRPYIEYLDGQLATAIDAAQDAMYDMAGSRDFNFNSARDVASLLFSRGFIHPETQERTYYPPVSFTKTGQIQTTDKVMQHLVAKHGCPFSAKTIVFKKSQKAKNTFLANVYDLSELDGFLHTNYNIHGTGTGRLSSHDENMQNIPKKLAGHSIKKMFIPSDDSMVFVNADAKNAEVRIFCAYSRDAQLIKSVNDGLDTHAFIGSEIVKAVRRESGAAAKLALMGLDDSRPLAYEDFAARDDIKVTDYKYGDMLDRFRTAVKRVVFGILYGAGSKKIAETIGISNDQAQAIIDLLFGLFPSIPMYMDQTKWELRTFGMVETYFGRRRRFNVKGAPRYMQGRAERQGVNFKIQSTSSEIVLNCLVGIEGPLVKDMGGRLLLTVHDSIGFEFPKKYLSQLPDFVKYHLQTRPTAQFPWLPVDFKWDFEVGENYGELHPYSAYMAKFYKPEVYSDIHAAYTEEEIRTALADPDHG